MVPETVFNTTKLKTCLEMKADCNNSVMFTPASLTTSKTMWLTYKHTGHKMHASVYSTAFV